MSGKAKIIIGVSMLVAAIANAAVKAVQGESINFGDILAAVAAITPSMARFKQK